MNTPLRHRFRLAVMVQVCLLFATLALLAWNLVAGSRVAVSAVLGIVAVIQVTVLVNRVFAHVDSLESFFAAINFEDLTRRFVTDDIDAELKTAFNTVIRRFQDARADRDAQAAYLATVVRHIPVAFLATRADGSISMVNASARRLSGIATLTHIRDLAALDPGLPYAMGAIEPGSQALLQARIRDAPAELRVSVSEIRMQGGTERLYALENLSGELTAREASAWRNLIRVLTHEMMNTLTPVVSLARTCEGMLDDPGAADDLREALATIARRSEGLTNFVVRYRELLKVPTPVTANVRVRDALHGAVRLLRQELGATEVRIDVVPDALEVVADPQLLDQVLVNLLKNCIDALQGTAAPRIELGAKLEYGRVCLRVADNGPGIPDDLVDQAFVPFFTTRRDGSGIGLSLCRQIMTAHGGDISVDSSGAGAVFTLHL